MLLAALHESVPGTKLPIQDVRYSVAIEGKADMRRAGQNDAIDPQRSLARLKSRIAVNR
jgi:hypothetical protein